MNKPECKITSLAKEWFLNNKLHREDGPAVEYVVDGAKEWWLNGKLHRADGPAVECANGAKAWFLNGKRHREDGPAVEYVDGAKEWYLNGIIYCRSWWSPLKFAKGFVRWIEAVKKLRGKK